MADRVITHAQGEAIIAALQAIAQGCGGGATYTLTQDPQDGHIITMTGSNGYTVTITIPDRDTTYTPVVAGGAAGLMTGADKSKLDGIEAGAQVNPAPASAAPLMDGTAAVGSSEKYAREDHRHPTDTSRASTDPATASAAGLMSAGDKAKLDGVSFPVTVSGASVTFAADAAGRPVEVTAHIEAVQAAGTPSIDNPLPITGWTAATVTRTGFNLWGGERMLSDIKTACPQAVASGTNISFAAAQISDKTLLSGIFKPDTQYTFIFSFSASGALDGGTTRTLNLAIRYTDGSYNHVRVINHPDAQGTAVIVSKAGATITGLYGLYAGGNTTIDTAASGVFEGVVDASAFTSYDAQTVTVSFGEAGTVYGGTLDVTRGLLTVTHKGVDVSTLAVRDYGGFAGSVAFTAPDMLTGSRHVGRCSHGEVTTSTQAQDGMVWLGVGNNSIYWIGAKTLAGVSTLADFSEWLASAGVQVVYPLATPVTFQLTPRQIQTLAGVNAVYADCGSVDVTHWPGTGVPGQTAPTMEQFAALVARVAALEGGG